MTEQEFQKQVWRMYDKITTAEGVPGKVLGVNFTTKSVRAFISGAPEWIRCELIEDHTTGKGKSGDDDTIIEELHKKVLRQAELIDVLQEKNQQLVAKIGDNYLKNLMLAVNMLKEGLTEKKNKIEKVEKGLAIVAEIANKVEVSDES